MLYRQHVQHHSGIMSKWREFHCEHPDRPHVLGSELFFCTWAGRSRIALSMQVREYDDGVLVREEAVPAEQLEAVFGKAAAVKRRQRRARASKVWLSNSETGLLVPIRRNGLL